MNQSFKLILPAIRPMIQTIDWLFPKSCSVCKQIFKFEMENQLCMDCWKSMYHPQRVIFPNRPNCHIFSAGTYETQLKRILVRSKFKHHAESTEILNQMIKRTFAFIPFNVDIITSVPSDYWRSLLRGVDLPGTLAIELSKQTSIPFQKNLLRKTRDVDRQAKLSKIERQKNMNRVFQADSSITGKNILIIDDIITTGSTVLACYRSLLKQKPDKIAFLTCAKV